MEGVVIVLYSFYLGCSFLFSILFVFGMFVIAIGCPPLAIFMLLIMCAMGGF